MVVLKFSRRIIFVSALLLSLLLLSISLLYHTPSRVALHTICTSSGVCREGLPQPVPLKGASLRIMCVGDSVTMGPANTNSYRGELLKLLKGNTYDMVGSVGWGNLKPSELNRLEGGMARTIEDIYAQLAESLPKWRPNVVLLHLGTNDVAWHKDEDTAPDRLRAVIDLIVQVCPDATVLVAKLLPIGFRGPEVDRFNEKMEKTVVEHAAAGERLLWVPMWDAFEYKGHPMLFSDMSHPNEEGYKVMAMMWHKGLEVANGLGWLEEPVPLELDKPVDNRVHARG